MKLTLANIKELKRKSDSPLTKRVCNPDGLLFSSMICMAHLLLFFRTHCNAFFRGKEGMQLYSFQYFADSFACRFRFCFMQYSQIGIYILSGKKGIRKSLSRQGGNFLRKEKKRERLQSKTFPWFLDGVVFF